MRGRTVSSFGQLFGPMLISGGKTFVPSPTPSIVASNAHRGGIIVVRDEFNFEEDDDELAVLMAIMGRE